MIIDYSKVPVEKTIKNNTGNKIKFDLRDCFQTSLEIEDGDSAIVKVLTSEGLAILTRKIAELGLEFDEDVEPQPEPEPVAVETEEALVEAIADAKDGEEIKLIADIKMSENLKLDKNITLDLGTSTIDLGDKVVEISGDVTLAGDGKITSSNKNAATLISDGCKLTIDGGTVESTKLYGIMLDGSSEIVVKDGTVISADSCISANNTSTKFATITIDGGELTSNTDAAMYIPSPSRIVINDGTLNGGISARMGDVIVNGGTINSIAKDNDPIEKFYNYSGNVWLGDAIACMAGTYTAQLGGTNDLNIEINGGTINGLCDECSAVTIYNLGAVEQNISVTIKEDAELTVADTTQPVYRVVEAEDIVPEKAKDRAKYTAVKNTVKEDIADKYKVTVTAEDEVSE